MKRDLREKMTTARSLLIGFLLAIFVMLSGCGGEKTPQLTPLPSESEIPMETATTEPVSQAQKENSVAAEDKSRYSNDIGASSADLALLPQEDEGIPTNSAAAQSRTYEPVVTIPSVPPTEEPIETSPTAEPVAEPTVEVPLQSAEFAPGVKPSPTPIPKAPIEIAPSAHMSYKELVGDNGDYSMPHNVPSRDTYKILVDVTNQVVTVYKKESGAIVRQMLCTTGAKDTPTPRGIKKMGKGRARFGFFKDYDCYAQYCTQVVQGIYMHSVLYREKSARTLIKSSYRNLGRPSSHGCIRLSVPDARWIFYNIAPGTICEIKALKKDPVLRRSLRLASPPSSKK